MEHEPITWQALVAVALSGAGAVLGEVGDTLEAFARQFHNHHLYELERRAFHEQAALEIESFTRGLE